jgi:ribosomal protein S18 acetylase RimI-like enzyme
VIVNARLEAITEADFKTVANLADTIWRSHYSAIISMAQIDYMLAERFLPENLRSYLNSAGRWFEILWSGENPIGYCSYSLTSNPVEMKLEQLYLLGEFRGKGLGGSMLRHVENEARKMNVRLLMLQVNKHNEDSIAIYRNAGFQVRAEAIFDIGNGYVMDDYVMEKTI